MSMPKIEIPDDKFHPLFSNFFAIGSNPEGEFVLNFAFTEPPTSDTPQKTKIITRIALSKVGAQKLLNLLQMALNRQVPPSQDSPPQRF